MFRQRFLISVLVVGFCAIPASAALVTYTDSGSFAAGTTTDTFQNIDVTAGNLTSTSYTDLGVDFSDAAGLNVVTSLGDGWPAGGAIVASHTGPTTINISFPSGVNSIEFYTDAQLQYSYVYVSVTDSSGTINTSLYQVSPTTPLFFGVTTTDSTFTSFSVSTDYPNPAQLTLDDISIGSAGSTGETPEAATLLLVATGLFLMGWMRRRTQGATQAASRGTVRTMSTGITPA